LFATKEPKSFFDPPPEIRKPITSDSTSQTAVAEHAPANAADVPATKAENSQESDLENKITLRYGLHEIQGKRKEMEDAHHAEVKHKFFSTSYQTRFDREEEINLSGVFHLYSSLNVSNQKGDEERKSLFRRL